MKTAFVDKGYPVIIGECGAIRHTSPTTAMNESRAYYLKTFISKAKSYGIVPFLWDNGSTGTGEESYGLFKRKSSMSQVDNFSVAAIMEGAQTNYPTRIEYVDNTVTENNIYTLQGVMIKKNASNMDGLPKGIYLMKGKKYIVK